jgi:hypothetical protein
MAHDLATQAQAAFRLEPLPAASGTPSMPLIMNTLGTLNAEASVSTFAPCFMAA